MAGMGGTVSFIPRRGSGGLQSMLVTFAGDVSSNSANAVNIVLYVGTGSAPANGASVPGGATSFATILVNGVSLSSSAQIPYFIQGVYSTNNLNATFWFDIGVQISSGTIISLLDNSASIVEIAG
jgi:hypothetical protein